MKKILNLTLLTLACNLSLADIVAKDEFVLKNEYYTSYMGYYTSFAGTKSSSTSQAINTDGWIYASDSKTEYLGFSSWVTGYSEYKQGSGITGSGTLESSFWTDPTKVYGQATAGDTFDVLVLGDGGSVTLTFDEVIYNGDGYDFAVFENALNDTSLEFAFVEVSTDGENFVRFPSFYIGTESVGSDSTGGSNEASYAYNLGSKYSIGYGNGYDLQELQDAYAYALEHYDQETGTASETSVFSAEYMADLIENYAYIDLDNINYVRIVDIVGDGNTVDSAGNPIYDVYPTTGTSGFDLTGVGIINGTTAVPEPSTYALIFGIFTLGFVLYRKKRK